MSIRRLPDSELNVMQAIWACTPPVTRQDIEKKLSETYPIAQTTLLTLLSRLTEKGFLTVDKRGRGKTYTPEVTEAEYLASQSRSFIDRLCGGSISTFASALCDSGLSRGELDELRQLLERGQL